MWRNIAHNDFKSALIQQGCVWLTVLAAHSYVEHMLHYVLAQLELQPVWKGPLFQQNAKLTTKCYRMYRCNELIRNPGLLILDVLSFLYCYEVMIFLSYCDMVIWSLSDGFVAFL